jgi:ribosomal protein S18 acetylase RimI-like enzyme
MMHDEIQLRPARPADAPAASVLLFSAYLHQQMDYPLPKDKESPFLEQLAHFFRKANNRCSYQNIQVAERHSEVVGLVLSFGGQEEEQLNAAIGWQIEREAADDEWYVDALAVFTPWGRQGIGTRLLQAAEQRGRDHHYDKIALNVAQENTQALALYQHLHYVVTRQTFLYHQPHVRLVKQLNKEAER